MASVRVARAIAAKFSRLADKKVGDLSLSYSQKATQYFALADELESDANIFGAAPFAGGISVTNKDTVEDDDDRVKPTFRKGMNDYDGDPSEQEDDLGDFNC